MNRIGKENYVILESGGEEFKSSAEDVVELINNYDSLSHKCVRAKKLAAHLSERLDLDEFDLTKLFEEYALGTHNVPRYYEPVIQPEEGK